jgi:hypothetical protein
VIVFPLFASLVSLACAIVIGRDSVRRPKPDKIVWTIAFAIFAVAAGAEVIGGLAEWSPALARVYYLCGAVLVVGYLALGELYLLAGSKISRIAPGVTLLITALAITLVWDAPIDAALLANDGWRALDSGPALVALTVTMNTAGTLVLVGGALYSAWRFRKLGTQRHRMIGCILIAAGALVVAMGGTLTRFGRHEYLYIAMSIGVAIIFAGVLETRRSGEQRVSLATSGAWLPGLRRVATNGVEAVSNGSAHDASLLQKIQVRATGESADPGIAYIHESLLPLSEQGLSHQCAVWSVEARPLDRFSRDEARRVWAFRLRLGALDVERFDRLSPSAKLQLTDLYFEVFQPGEAIGAEPRAMSLELTEQSA